MPLGTVARCEELSHQTDAEKDLLNSEAGTEFFEINHGAISPDEMEGIISAIIDFTKYQFTKYKGKPSIYHKP